METCQNPYLFWIDDETPDTDIGQLLLATRQWSSRIESYSTLASFDMRSTQQMSITLPLEMAALVKAKVTSGEYASESEVIRDGLRALMARDRAMEDWLRDQVIPPPPLSRLPWPSALHRAGSRTHGSQAPANRY